MNNLFTNLSPFTIVILNCKGLNNNEKREKIFNILKANYADIICLQETNTNLNLSKLLTSYWYLDVT